MNREELRAQIQAAADRLTEELVEYFGEMLQSVVKDVTIGVGEAKPLRKAAPPSAPRKAVAKKAAPKKAAPKKAAPKKAAKKAEKKAAKKAAPKKAAKKAEKKPAKKAAPKKAEKKAAPKKAAPKQAAPKKAEKKAAPKKSALPQMSGRRSNKELDQAADLVYNFLKEQGRGMRIEEINKALGTSTRELMRPIKKLLAAKRIQRRGERRSTTYFVG